MDWDEIKAPSRTFGIGEELRTLSVAELTDRVTVLEAEIVRVKSEIEAKQRQATAADAFFRS